MKLFIKRYVLPIIITFFLYSLVYLASNINQDPWFVYFNNSLVIVICYAYLIRIQDDYLDYENDLINNKTIFNKTTLVIIGIIILIVNVITIIISKYYLLFIPLIILLLLWIFKQQDLIDFIKPLYLPSIILTLCYNVFRINIFTIMIVIILLVIDHILISKKEEK